MPRRPKLRLVGSTDPTDVFDDLTALRQEQQTPGSQRRQRLTETFARIPHARAVELALYRVSGPAWFILVELDRLILKGRGRNPIRLVNRNLRTAGIHRNTKARALRHHFLDHLRATRVELFLHQQGLDTTSPAGRAMFGMLSVFSEFERAIIQERIAAGMARAKAKGTKSGKPIGRPRIAQPIKDRIRAAHQVDGASLRDLAAQFRVGRETVRRVLCGGD